MFEHGLYSRNSQAPAGSSVYLESVTCNCTLDVVDVVDVVCASRRSMEGSGDAVIISVSVVGAKNLVGN